MNSTIKQFKVLDMHCGSCATLIEADLEDAGIKAECDFAHSTLRVEFDQDLINENHIHQVVKKSGYSLEPL